MTFAFPSPRVIRAADEAARELALRIGRVLLVALGVMIMLAGVAIAPLPGPLGLPVIAVGLIVVLRNSFAARRRFVKLQRAHPKMVSPIRRMIRRDPEVAAVLWQQVLRLERVLLPSRRRFLTTARRRARRRTR